MLMIKLDPETEKHVAEQAERSGMSIDAFVREAIGRMLEDIDDLAAAQAMMHDYDPATNVPLEEVKRRFGLED